MVTASLPARQQTQTSEKAWMIRKIHPLEPGDSLTRIEYGRACDAMAKVERVEDAHRLGLRSIPEAGNHGMGM